jgi:putative acetyltransferase
MDTSLVIRKSTPEDIKQLLFVERAAFNSEEEAKLVSALLSDSSAAPRLSLLALIDQQAVGHILFSHARLDPTVELNVSILAPLAVVPAYQNKGIGGALIMQGLKQLKTADIDLVFVLGHPRYYPKFGFSPAIGIMPPYPLPEGVADPWMVQASPSKSYHSYQGQVICARALDKPEYWCE